MTIQSSIETEESWKNLFCFVRVFFFSLPFWYWIREWKEVININTGQCYSFWLFVLFICLLSQSFRHYNEMLKLKCLKTLHYKHIVTRKWNEMTKQRNSNILSKKEIVVLSCKPKLVYGIFFCFVLEMLVSNGMEWNDTKWNELEIAKRLNVYSLFYGHWMDGFGIRIWGIGYDMNRNKKKQLN